MSDSPFEDIPKVIDADSLGRWLRPVSQEIGQQIANRAALRMMPVGWDWLIESAGVEVTMPLLTCAYYASNPLGEPTKKLPKNVQNALFYNADYSTRAAATRHPGPSSVLSAINSAAAATTLPFTHSTRSAVSAVASGAHAYGLETAQSEGAESTALARTTFWAEVHADCTLISENADLKKTQLWTLQTPPFDAHWQRVKQALQGKPEWENWLHWYESVLMASPFSIDLLADS